MTDWLIAEYLIAIAAVITATTIVIVASIKTSKVVKKIVHFFDDYFGEDERPGIPPRPGFSERIGQIESCMSKVDDRLIEIENKIQFIDAQVKPNNGSSLRDAINRIEKRLNAVEESRNV